MITKIEPSNHKYLSQQQDVKSEAGHDFGASYLEIFSNKNYVWLPVP